MSEAMIVGLIVGLIVGICLTLMVLDVIVNKKIINPVKQNGEHK